VPLKPVWKRDGGKRDTLRTVGGRKPEKSQAGNEKQMVIKTIQNVCIVTTLEKMVLKNGVVVSST
jgi:hypothetical protein